MMEGLSAPKINEPVCPNVRERESNPLVSIITFVKNRCDLIPRCIDSVLNQTYSNFEYIIQDGASVDGTLELINRYKDKTNKG